jgi:hypothetical protein
MHIFRPSGSRIVSVRLRCCAVVKSCAGGLTNCAVQICVNLCQLASAGTSQLYDVGQLIIFELPPAAQGSSVCACMLFAYLCQAVCTW